MKLCFLTGANSIHSYRWIEYFVNKGYEIHWISLAPVVDYGIEIKNLKFYLSPYPIEKCKKLGTILTLKPLFNIFWIRKLIKKIKPDILHAHYAVINGISGALSGFHPFILTAWGSDVLIGSQSKILKPFIKFALNKADLITCNGKELRERIEWLGISPRKIRFVYWGIDTPKFKPGLRNEKVGEKLEIFDSPTIISLRTLEPIYNIESLIHSIPLVLKDIPKAKFIIAGNGSEKENLRKLANSLGVSDSVRFVGWIPYDELPEYLNSVDIYVSTSLSDGGLSQSTGQAMACQLPVITTDLGVNKDLIRDGENGFLVPIKDPKSLAKKIIILLKNKNLRAKLGSNGRKTIENKIDYYKEMGKAENIYKELINNKAHEK